MIMNKSKNIVITGANRGIGFSALKKIAENGGNVWACMRDVSQDRIAWIHEIEEKNHVWIKPVELELISEESIRMAAKKILSDKLQIDGIVNNAGVTGPIKLFSMMSMEEIRKTFDVNFFGPSLLTQRLLKNMMRHKNGSIVNIVSVAAIDGEPAQYAYVSSKAAMIGATKKLSSELAPYQIRVNAVAPGMIDTDMGDIIDGNMVQQMLTSIPMKRKGNADEVANVILYLLSEEASYISGQIFRVDGGKI